MNENLLNKIADYFEKNNILKIIEDEFRKFEKILFPVLANFLLKPLF